MHVPQNGKKYILHKQSTLAEGPEKTLDKIKKTKVKKLRQEDDLAPPSQLRSEAIGVLAQTSRRFVESAFNRASLVPSPAPPDPDPAFLSSDPDVPHLAAQPSSRRSCATSAWSVSRSASRTRSASCT